MKTLSILNSNAGSVPLSAHSDLAEALRACDHKIDNLPLDFNPDTLDQALKDFQDNGGDCVIVWGGDGTVAAVANALTNTSIPVLPLPGGTMNLLHRRVHGTDSSWKDCLKALGSLDAPYTLRPGQLNDRLFYVAAMFGPLTQLADVREALREGRPLEAAQTAFGGDTLDMSSQVEFEFPRKRDMTEESAVAVAAFLSEQEDDHLQVGAIDPNSLLDLSSVGFEALVNGWQHANRVDVYSAKSLLIRHVEGETLRYTLDGERFETDETVSVGIAETPMKFLSLRAAS